MSKKKDRQKIVKSGKKARPNKLKQFFQSISWKNMSKEIEGYGYNYSMKRFILQMLLVTAAVVGAAYFYYLNLINIAIIIIASLMAFPLCALAQFRYLWNNDRFEQVVNYMESMIIAFKQTPKILFAMKQSLDLADGRMKECLEEAIYIIENHTEADVYKKAFAVIENEFPCSRIKTLHRFILNVEEENSTNYHESLDNLYFDIRSWVTRTYQYQTELKGTKSKILIILILSLFIAGFFTQVIAQAGETVIGFTTSPLYQIISLLYLIAFVIIYTVMETKINGQWLINDITSGKDEKIARYIDYVVNYDKKKELKKSAIAACFGLAVVIVGFVIGNKNLAFIGMLLTAFLAAKSRFTYNSRKKAVERELLKEFPVWMRDIAINLNNMVVIKAIEASMRNCSYIMRYFLSKFLEEVDQDPNSIRPYLHFLGIFKVSELNTAFKTLYSIKMMSAGDASRLINDLIMRNQTLLEESERMRNQDSLAGISFISLLPMLLMSFKLMGDMALLMIQFMGIISSAM